MNTSIDELDIDLIRKLGIPQIITSAESNQVVEQRAKKLKLPIIYNVSDKLYILKSYCVENKFKMECAMFLGNDVNDLEAMTAVGYLISSADGHSEI